jgi:hypothetical protein
MAGGALLGRVDVAAYFARDLTEGDLLIRCVCLRKTKCAHYPFVILDPLIQSSVRSLLLLC